MQPRLFNVFVDVVISQWVTVLAATEDGREGVGLSIRDLAAYFYAKNGLVALTQPERLQREFDVIEGLFYRFGLRTNTSNTVRMA